MTLNQMACGTLACALWLSAAAPASAATRKIDFNRDIRPILSDNCYACHGIDGSSRKAELRLDRWEFATAKRKDGGPAIIPGKADESPLVERIESTDEKKIMPPPEGHKTLRPEEIATLRRWIAELKRTGAVASHLRREVTAPYGATARAQELAQVLNTS